jgi:hypothetical protein
MFRCSATELRNQLRWESNPRLTEPEVARICATGQKAVSSFEFQKNQLRDQGISECGCGVEPQVYTFARSIRILRH